MKDEKTGKDLPPPKTCFLNKVDPECKGLGGGPGKEKVVIKKEEKSSGESVPFELVGGIVLGGLAVCFIFCVRYLYFHQKLILKNNLKEARLGLMHGIEVIETIIEDEEAIEIDVTGDVPMVKVLLGK